MKSFTMWTDYELEKIGKLFEKLPEESLEDFLPLELREAIIVEEGKVYENIR